MRSVVKSFLGRVLLRIEESINSWKSSYYSSIWPNTTISGDVEFSFPQKITIGSGTLINAGSRIYASKNGSVFIGEDCLISYNVSIRTLTHHYINKDETIKKQGLLEKSVIIDDDVWIGYGCIIMPGVHIGKGAVIGAGAVVTKDIKPYSVNVGIPARMIKERVIEDKNDNSQISN